MRRRPFLTGCFVLLLVGTWVAHGENRPFEQHHLSLSLVPPLQTTPPSGRVDAFRFNLLYGRNEVMEGLDLGLVNRATRTASGMALGAVNIADGASYGFRMGLLNVVGGDAGALHLGLYNHANRLAGGQIGLVNYASWLGGTTQYMACQFGLLNITRSLDDGGIQIGLLNVALEGTVSPVLPLVNARF